MLCTKPPERTICLSRVGKQSPYNVHVGSICMDAKFSGLGDGQRQKTDKRQGTVTKFPHEAFHTVGSMETHQCGQLTGPRVETNKISVKSF